MTPSPLIDPAPALTLQRSQAYAGELRELAREKLHAADAAAAAAEAWAASLARHCDAEGRALGEQAVTRALDRHVQLRAVLKHASRDRLEPPSVGEVLRGAGRVAARRHPRTPVVLSAHAPADRLTTRVALALEVAVLVAISNTDRHAAVGTLVNIEATPVLGELHVVVAETSVSSVREKPRLSQGRGTQLAELLVRGAGGRWMRRTTSDGVRVSISLPLGGEVEASPDRLLDQVDLLEAIHQTAAAIQNTHGFAQPLLEARWLAGGADGARLTVALERIGRVGEALRERLLDLGLLRHLAVEATERIRVPVGSTTTGIDAGAASQVRDLAPWAAARAFHSYLLALDGATGIIDAVARRDTAATIAVSLAQTPRLMIRAVIDLGEPGVLPCMTAQLALVADDPRVSVDVCEDGRCVFLAVQCT